MPTTSAAASRPSTASRHTSLSTNGPKWVGIRSSYYCLRLNKLRSTGSASVGVRQSGQVDGQADDHTGDADGCADEPASRSASGVAGIQDTLRRLPLERVSQRFGCGARACPGPRRVAAIAQVRDRGSRFRLKGVSRARRRPSSACGLRQE